MQISADPGTFADDVTLPNFDKYGSLVSGTHFSKGLLDSHKTRQKAARRAQQQLTEHTLPWLQVGKIQLLG